MFGMMMKFKATEFDGFFESTNATKPCFLEKIVGIGWVATYDELNVEGKVIGGEEEYFDSLTVVAMVDEISNTKFNC